MFNQYLIDMELESRREEIHRAMTDVRACAQCSPPPSALRRAFGSAIVRFGLFLDADAFRYPETAAR